jgi:hypothetical protein
VENLHLPVSHVEPARLPVERQWNNRASVAGEATIRSVKARDIDRKDWTI